MGLRAVLKASGKAEVVSGKPAVSDGVVAIALASTVVRVVPASRKVPSKRVVNPFIGGGGLVDGIANIICIIPIVKIRNSTLVKNHIIYFTFNYDHPVV
jgi:hypothetical protein